ncbi:MAG: SdrD B-like domain-containing protein [Candidatus Zixiibacteriota bacterium]
MLKASKLLVLPIVAAIMIAGCSQDPDQTNLIGPDLSAAYVPAAGDAVTSATLYVYVWQSSGHNVTTHQVTADWAEAAVTWNNFGGAFNGAAEGSFLADSPGWRTVNLTALVTAWSDGSYSNFGVLLKQGFQEVPRTWIYSRENATNQPYLEVCYSTAGGPVCVQYPCTGDASIAENLPNDNFGLINTMFVGWPAIGELEKQALLRFDVPPVPEVASLGDFVWYDDNENGIQDAGEVGIPGVTVHLMDCAGNILATAVTNASGYYLFSNLMPGNYNVHFVAPLGFVFSPQDQGGDDALDSDVNPANGMTICTTLEGGENDLTWDAGLYMPPPPEGCSLTIGYWKNHAGFGPQPDYLSQFLPIWLGTAGGARSIYVNTVQIAYDILTMQVYGTPTNGITKLYAQLLAAKLNIANGADGSAIAGTIAAADAFLANRYYLNWNSLSKTQKKNVLAWLTMLDNYNNGIIGPGHCDIIGDGNDE